MKPDDIFHRMTSEQRLRYVAARRCFLAEMYSSPDEIIADLALLIGKLDEAKAQQERMAADLRRLVYARDEIVNNIAAAFKKFQFAYGAQPCPNLK